MKIKYAILTLLFLCAATHAKNESFVDWNSYFVNVNNELASVFVNLRLHESAPFDTHPTLSWYWVEMKEPKENGLSSRAEYNSLIAHEDALLAHLAGSSFVYAGRITTQGRREFYFYTAADFDFVKSIQQSFADTENYRYQLGQKSDSQWEHYLDLLYPGENGLSQMQKNQQ